MRSIIIFAVIQAISFALGSSDAVTIAIIVLASAVLIFGSVFISAFLKDRIQKRKLTHKLLGTEIL